MAAQTNPTPSIMKQGRLTPWLYLLPALIVMATFIVYPGLNTLYLSLRNNAGNAWAGDTCNAERRSNKLTKRFMIHLANSNLLTTNL